MLYKSLKYIVDANALTVTTSDGESLNIRPKTCQFLLFLLRNAGEPVHKQVLLDEVWADSVVEEQIVFQSVNELRQLFAGTEVIKTIPRKGYVWLPDVEEVSSSQEINSSIFSSKPVLILSLCAVIAFGFLFVQQLMPTKLEENAVADQNEAIEKAGHSEISGSVVVLPTTNKIQGNDHGWVRLGLMDQLIQRLPSDSQHGILQTDYVLEVLERANAPLSNVKAEHIGQIFKVSGANLIVATKLSGSPHEYQLSYTLYRPKFKKQGVLFDSDTQKLVDKLSVLLANILGSDAPLSADQYHADFNHQMLGVAIDFRLESNYEAAVPLLITIVEKDPLNFTAQRILVESLIELGRLEDALVRLDNILPEAVNKSDKEELVRLMYLKSISFTLNNNFKDAELVAESALQIAKDNYDWLYQAYLLDLKARFAIERKEYDIAEALYYESMKHHQVLKCPVGETASWINLALLAKNQSQTKKQAKAFEKAMAIAKQRDLINQISYINKLRN